MNMLRKRNVVIALFTLSALLLAGYYNRHNLVQLMATGTIGLDDVESVVLSSSARWFDDYYTIEYIDEKTIAIGEPRFWQKNFSYLILGDERALLFDSGSGIRGMRKLVNSLTALPVIVTSSHLHFDHVGNHSEFETVGMIDLPNTRKNVRSNGIFSPKDGQYLTEMWHRPKPEFTVTQWWSHEETIDLGNRKLQVMHTPGHTDSSMMLLDKSKHMLFTGDFIYPGELVAFFSDSNLDEYLASAIYLLKNIQSGTKLLTAHSDSSALPKIGYQHLVELRHTLAHLEVTEPSKLGFLLKTYRVNDHNSLTVPR